MINNIELFKFSLDNLEEYFETYYEKENFILNNDGSLNELIIQNNKMLEYIEQYYKLLTSNQLNELKEKDIVLNMISILDNTYWINNSEFTNYWWIFDTSYSSYTWFAQEEKFDFVKNILPKYIENRHLTYRKYWYSPVSLQVRFDSTANKRSADLWNKKVEALLRENNFVKFWNNENSTLEDFLKSNRWFLYADKDWKKMFTELLKQKQITFEWSTKLQDKYPDFCLKIWNKIFIMEHKHMKEGGGWQNKQIAEIIDLINFSETNPDIHYVSFLDGVFFNKLSNKNNFDPKTKAQVEQIENALKNHKQNYFLNTKGFLKLINSI